MKDVHKLLPSDFETIRRNCCSVLNSNAHFRKICAEVKASYDPVKGQFFKVEGLRFKSFHKSEIIQLCCLFHFDEESYIKYYFLSEIQSYLLKAKGLEDLIFLCRNDTFKSYLLCSTRMERRLMLSLFTEESLNTLLDNFRVKVIYSRTSKPKRLIRHKGYRDHGTLPEYSDKVIREEIQKHVPFEVLQNAREDYDESIQNFLQLHLSYLQARGESEFNNCNQKELKGGIYLCYKKN